MTPPARSALGRLSRCTLIDVNKPLMEIPFHRFVPRLSPAFALALALAAAPLLAQTAPAAANPPMAGPPPSGGGFFPLSEVHAGLKATAWTIFSGNTPEPMDVEILGVLRGARGPGHDMILVQLHGAKPEYTGVVAGMSGSPVYVGTRLLGSLSYRIGQFARDPIAGVTPIEQMLEVRDLPIAAAQPQIREQALSSRPQAFQLSDQQTMQAMETPLVMGGFHPEAIRLWQQQMAGTGLETVTAGGMGSSSAPASATDHAAAWANVAPGSAVSAQLVRGDLEIAATCTVTYVDPKQLLACGHPVLQAGPVSLPMTTSEVVATLASPLNAFKIVNTGATIGAFTEDRDSAIRGVFGATAQMIPVSIAVHGAQPAPSGTRHLNVEILDLPSLTAQALMVTLYNALLQTNQSADENSYHLTGAIHLAGYPPTFLDLWSTAGENPAALLLAMQAAERFQKLYSNGGRTGTVESIQLDVQVIPHPVKVVLEAARLISSNIAHAGDTVMVEATLRPWRQPVRNVRIPITLPARLAPGNLRLLVSDSGTLDRTLDQPRQSERSPDMETLLAQTRRLHPADRVYISLLVPEAQAGITGQTLTSLPLSMANALEPQRATASQPSWPPRPLLTASSPVSRSSTSTSRPAAV